MDIVIKSDHKMAAIEVKAGASANATAVSNLSRFRDRLGDRFSCRVVLHTGTRGNQLTDRIYLLPISALWDL